MVRRYRDLSASLNPILQVLLDGRASISEPVWWETDGWLSYRDLRGRRTRTRIQWSALAGHSVRHGPRGYWADWAAHRSGQRALVEHTSINPVHPMHLGALRSTLIGGTLARLLRSSGADVTVHYFVNDLGRQVVLLDWILARTNLSVVPSHLRFDVVAGVLYSLVNMILGERGKDIDRLTEAHSWIASAVPQQVRDRSDLQRRLSMAKGPSAGFVSDMVQLVVDDMAAVGAGVDVFERESDLPDPLDTLLFEILAAEDAVSVNGTWCLRRDGGLVPVGRSNGSSLYFLRDLANCQRRDARITHMYHVIGDDQALLQRTLRDLLARRGVVSEHVSFGAITSAGKRFSSRQNRLITVAEILGEEGDRLQEISFEMALRRPDRAIDVAKLAGWPYQRVRRAHQVARDGVGVRRTAAAMSDPRARVLAISLARGIGATHTALHKRSPHPLARYLLELSEAYSRAAAADVVMPWARDWYLDTYDRFSVLIGISGNGSESSASRITRAA
ncbi:hypothetical protein Q0Z83_054030 [Actinoplanes sichuanensis]|uniref:Arginine--tRNA ligase n=1 Tax=Actinoplanes sichuanensis TaxID=512349 RepID=A0ABW4AT54_9ACTN|nr:arginine--tRNA ligase [Actinoplanes sichuanensis]BEL07212.1 hypothetical protein Q0Z83_054030 [Actinoplanes sichuanensis]